jgi:uncharacterized protein (DUF427 family)
MPKAIWNNAVIADAAEQDIVVVEGNRYFPASSVASDRLRPSVTRTVCPWKGTASYYDVVVNGEVNPEAAWYYPTPKPAASNITGYIAFWHGVKVEK